MASPTYASILPAKEFNPEQGAEKLRKAMKGLGTNEDTIIEVLTNHTFTQRIEIDKKFKQMFGRDLLTDLKKEISGKFLDVAQALFDAPRVYDAKKCNEATSGVGTDEDLLIEILTTRSNQEIQQIKEEYKKLFKRELEADIRADTSGDFRRLLTSLVTGHRENRTTPDVELAKKEAMELYKAGEKKIGTDESTFNRILCLRSPEQLRETFNQYSQISKNDIEEAIKSELSGDLESGALAIVKSARNPAAFFAERLHNSMKGAGTKDQALIRQIVSRSEVDMQLIKKEFNRLYGKSLYEFIKGDTSGDYRQILLGIVKQ